MPSARPAAAKRPQAGGVALQARQNSQTVTVAKGGSAAPGMALRLITNGQNVTPVRPAAISAMAVARVRPKPAKRPRASRKTSGTLATPSSIIGSRSASGSRPSQATKGTIR
jgi:hypothetical protein